MFYRIKDNKVYDYADYKYAEDCLNTNVCTMAEFNDERFVLSGDSIIPNGNYESLIYQKRQEQFQKEFFQTSLGWIRRKVTMKDGSQINFLTDLLPSVKMGLELGQSVQIITYRQPDFNIEPDLSYMESLQEKKNATSEFITECLMQTVKDFAE